MTQDIALGLGLLVNLLSTEVFGFPSGGFVVPRLPRAVSQQAAQGNRYVFHRLAHLGCRPFHFIEDHAALTAGADLPLLSWSVLSSRRSPRKIPWRNSGGLSGDEEHRASHPWPFGRGACFRRE